MLFCSFSFGGGVTEGEFNVDRGDFGWEGRVLCVCVFFLGGGGCIVRVTVGARSSFFVFSLFGYSWNS